MSAKTRRDTAQLERPKPPPNREVRDGTPYPVGIEDRLQEVFHGRCKNCHTEVTRTRATVQAFYDDACTRGFEFCKICGSGTQSIDLYPEGDKREKYSETSYDLDTGFWLGAIVGVGLTGVLAIMIFIAMRAG